MRLLAPVLSFTADEVWQFMPGQREESVHLAAFPALHPEWKDDALVARWERIMKVRADVSKALELARVAKTIGHSLDAAVTIAAPPELFGIPAGVCGRTAEHLHRIESDAGRRIWRANAGRRKTSKGSKSR